MNTLNTTRNITKSQWRDMSSRYRQARNVVLRSMNFDNVTAKRAELNELNAQYPLNMSCGKGYESYHPIFHFGWLIKLSMDKLGYSTHRAMRLVDKLASLASDDGKWEQYEAEQAIRDANNAFYSRIATS